MPRELPDKITPIALKDIWNALLLRWETLGVNPTRSAVELKLAHIHLEIGSPSKDGVPQFGAAHNYNLGNVKSYTGDNRSWQYFACGEEVQVWQLDSIRKVSPSPDLVVVKSQYKRGDETWASVWLKPKHPWTKFAAFDDLIGGVETQFAYLRKRPNVLAALMSGSPEVYNDALAAAHYYTAGKAMYLDTLKQRLELMRRACRDFDWGDVA